MLAVRVGLVLQSIGFDYCIDDVGHFFVVGWIVGGHREDVSVGRNECCRDAMQRSGIVRAGQYDMLMLNDVRVNLESAASFKEAGFEFVAK